MSQQRKIQTTQSFSQSSARNILSGFLLVLFSACQLVETPQPDVVLDSSKEVNTSPVAVMPVLAPIPAADTPQADRDTLNIWNRIRDGLTLQNHYEHENVLRELQWYQDKQKFFDQIALRATPFLFWIVEELEKRDLPMELALIPVIESGYNPQAYSRVHAVGLWQFMRATARSFGLEENWWYDGRRDPLAATVAALDYLEVLHKEFDGDWLLAMAAYNTGEGNIARAIRRNKQASKPVDFWNLRLASETRKHVPRILAIASIVANEAQHGIRLQKIENAPYFAQVEVNSQIDLNLAASLAGIEPSLLKSLNPGYQQWATHPDYPQHLLVPLVHSERFQKQLELLNVDQRVTWDRYEILSGDSLNSIARKLGTRTDILQKVNGLRSSRIIAGKSLLLPRTTDTALLDNTAVPVNRSTAAVSIPPEYSVRRGDSLWQIARRYGLNSANIAAVNSIAMDSILRPGQTLQLIPSELLATTHATAAQHTVIRGDSLNRIARRYKFTVQQLLNVNTLAVDSVIYPGQTIKLPNGE